MRTFGAPENRISRETFGDNESARSDKVTGGNIEEAALSRGNPNIKITVNLPAFLLTVWQDGRQIETYPIGIGLRSYPVVIGEREATRIVYNPTWIPPDSKWVRRTRNVRPGEAIRSSDPRNPLGKLKIPLGEGYLIHQAAKRTDIGRLVSHGCIRMLADDILQLAEYLIRARDLPVSKQQVESAKRSHKRVVIQMDEPVRVDINYDTIVVEARTLHIYPDVYRRGTNSVTSLRTELQEEGVDTSSISDAGLNRMIRRASRDKGFSVLVSDLHN
jgi:murein L,D-transpeptidase YcbB/YkuD